VAKRGLFRKRKPAPQSRTAAFESQIERHEDLLFGVALYFECVKLLYAGNESAIQVQRHELRGVIRKGRDNIDRAAALLEEARHDETKEEAIDAFSFRFCEGYPRPSELIRRADILVQTHGRLFPGRDRSDPFTQDEILGIMEAASDALAESSG
jgi:hypothetical protein